MATDKQQITEQMRRAAEFVLKHHHALQHALTAQAFALDEQMAALREIARHGGNGWVTAQAAAETSKRKAAEAASMRAAQAALSTVIGPPLSPEPDDR